MRTGLTEGCQHSPPIDLPELHLFVTDKWNSAWFLGTGQKKRFSFRTCSQVLLDPFTYLRNCCRSTGVLSGGRRNPKERRSLVVRGGVWRLLHSTRLHFLPMESQEPVLTANYCPNTGPARGPHWTKWRVAHLPKSWRKNI